MTQRTRSMIANVLLGVSILMIVTFLAQHFMAPPRPSWHKDLPWLALACVSAFGLVRGRPRRAMRT